jgi:short-subunit dehydrogenase
MSDSEAFRAAYGPWALVTGAARGIGAEFANQIALAGLHLVLVDRDEAELHDRCNWLRDQHGVEIRPLVLDLAGENILDSLLPEIANLPIHLLVNNAGIAKVGPFLPQDRGFLLEQLHVNTRAVLLLTHALGNRMCESRRGGIIIVSSGAAWAGSALNAHYAATKAYELILAESLWAELAADGIDVLGFMPTSTDTNALWRETPRNPRFMVMSTEETVRRALHGLGRKPSLLAGPVNAVAHRVLRTLLPRKALIRLGGWAIRSMSESSSPRP